MDSLESMLKQFYASVADREKGAAYIRQFPEQYDHLFKLACSPEQDRVHIVAAWILEKYLLPQLDLLTDTITPFIKGVAVQEHESKRRPMVKLLFHYCRQKQRRELLTKKQKDLIVTLCFDYMISAKKVAAIAFAMKTLHFFRNHAPWINEEIKAYIDQRLPHSSNGFRSLVRQISID